MEIALITVGLIVALLMAYAHIKRLELQNRELGKLRAQVKQAEEHAAQQTKEQLENADIVTTVGFLNRVHKDNSGPN